MGDFGLGGLERLMHVFEEVQDGGGSTDFSVEMNGLVSPYREFVRTEEVELRRAPFSSSEPEAARMYVFTDVILLAVPTGKGTPKSIGSMLAEGDAGKRSTLTRYKGKYRAVEWVDLHRCGAKEVSSPSGGHTGVQLTVVKRTLEAKKTGTLRVLTQVQKLELWFDSEAVARDTFGDVQVIIDELIEIDLRRPSVTSMTDTDSNYSGGPRSFASGTDLDAGDDDDDDGELTRTRSWASRKNRTLRRNGTLKSRGTMRSAASSVNGEDGDSVGGLSLADLESRYRVKISAAPTAAEGSVEFLVEYGEGPMGFSLSSGPNIGVVVGKVADGSFSDEAGVCVADRVVEVGSKEISLVTPWKDVVGLIKAAPRPLRIKFERFAGRAPSSEDGGSEDGGSVGSKRRSLGRSLLRGAKAGSRVASKAVAKAGAGAGSATGEVKEKAKKRAWAAKRAQRAHADNVDQDDRLINLKEVEKLYRSGRAAERSDSFAQIQKMFASMRERAQEDDARLNMSLILEEMWVTERTYVLDLRMLVREFILPLRRKVHRGKCKDVGGGRICEHNKLRSSCGRPSDTVEPLVSNADMRIIFANVETLVKINTELLADMEKDLLRMSAQPDKVQAADVAGVYGPAFRRVMPFFKMYALYCHQYTTAIDHLLVLRTHNEDVDAALKVREKKAQVSLSSLLIRPVQRICKYPLLFKGLLRHVSELPGDKSLRAHVVELEKAAAVVQGIAGSVNQIVADAEANETLIDIYTELGGAGAVPWLIEPSRKFITKVHVMLLEAPFQDTTVAKLHTMYLCSDIILFGKDSTSRFGSLTKTGGRKGAARAVSLRRTFGGSLKKKGSEVRSSARHKSKSNSLHKSGGRGTGRHVVKLTKTIELVDVKPTLLPNPDANECFGIEVKYVERKMEGGKRAGGTGKQVTNINKMQLWLPTKDEQEAVFEDLTDGVQRLKAQKDGHKKAQRTLGTPRATRNWKSGGKNGFQRTLTK